MGAEKTILVVEDNLMNRTMLVGILSSEYTVLEAENGQAALDVLKEYSEEISLILLDIIMPVMNGYEFLSIMKANPYYSSIPVIVTAQNDGESDEVAALSYGATDFVAKPYKPQIILHRVASIINLRETAAMINQFKYDRLTGLYSKEFFYQRVKELLLRNPDKKYDLICSDIENFKLINDVFGTLAGDNLLRNIAALYRKCVGGVNGIYARLDSDRFAAVIERHCDYNDKMFIDATDYITDLFNVRNVDIKWGIYEIKDPQISVEQMCDRALLASNSIKGMYGKYFAKYDDKLRDKLLREQSITNSMESAIDEGQFELYFQPKYKIYDETLSGAEALVRWNHPQWGLLAPGAFIPLFERNGFITKLDMFVWDRTCAILREWDDRGLPQISVSVNVSRADIYNADLADILIKIVSQYNLHPSRLHLEITESAYTEDPQQLIDTITKLRELGFIIEMDDFGSGYSSLNMLNQMPLDILKLDMRFMKSVSSKNGSRGILQFIIGLARWMKFIVVAEGVETMEQVEQLRQTGCDYAQGYYYSRPVPKSDFEKLLIDSRSDIVPLHQWNEISRTGKRLFVADMDTDFINGIKQIFGNDFTVLSATDTNKALDIISKHKYELTAAIIDTEMAGHEKIFDALGLEQLIMEIPTLAIGPANISAEEMAFKYGADDYLAKPHSLALLRKRMVHLLGDYSEKDYIRILRHPSYRDSLTGLLNKDGLTSAINCLGKVSHGLTVYIFEISNLKAISDKHGQTKADILLQNFAKVLRTHTRDNDILATLSENTFIAAMGTMKKKSAQLRKGREISDAFSQMDIARQLGAKVVFGTVLYNTGDTAGSMIERVTAMLPHSTADLRTESTESMSAVPCDL